jgi:radical SAM-linked protein
LAEAGEKINWLKQELQLPGVKFKWQDPGVSLIEGVFARGDRRLAGLLEAAHAKGCQFDGWSDHFDLNRWREAFDQTAIDPGFYTTRIRELCEPLPWDHLDMRISKAHLQSEWRRALCTETVTDCREGDCHQCGSCDFSQIAPRTYANIHFENMKGGTGRPSKPALYRKVRLSYSKTGPAKYFGHLELKNIILRAIKRAGIQLKFSEGFHPQPKVSFQDALPIGLESEAEHLVLQVATSVQTRSIVERLNAQLPPGIAIVDCSVMVGKSSRPSLPAAVSYQISLRKGRFNPQMLDAFMKLENPTVTVNRPKGRLKKIAIKDILIEISLQEARQLRLTLAPVPGKTLRPAEIVAFVFALPENQVKQARIVKTRVKAPLPK